MNKSDNHQFDFFKFQGIKGVFLLNANMSDFYYKKHSHQEFSIGVTKVGIQSFNCKGSSYNVSPRGIMTFNPEDVHDGHSGLETGLNYEMLYINPKVIINMAQELNNSKFNSVYFKNTVQYNNESAAELLSLFHAIKQKNNIFELQSKFYETIGNLLIKYGDFSKLPLSTHKDNHLINRACQYIKENAYKDISLVDISNYLNMSPFYFSRSFKETTLLSPHNYLNQCRINLVKKNLESDISLAELAILSGFSDQSHMNRRFKEIYGVSVGQYRNHISNK